MKNNFDSDFDTNFKGMFSTMKTVAIVGALGSVAAIALIVGAILYGIRMFKEPAPALPAPAVSSAVSTPAADLPRHAAMSGVGYEP